MANPKHPTKFYINGEWRDPSVEKHHPVVDPSTEQEFSSIAFGAIEDVHFAVTAAKEAFPEYSVMPSDQRIALINRVRDIYIERSEDLASAMSMEMGAPTQFAKGAQVTSGRDHIDGYLNILSQMNFDTHHDGTNFLTREPIGVCGLITPWNWPMNQVTLKVIPALAVGCTIVLKPSEVAPISSLVFTEIIDEAGFPPGVFNLVNGDGPTVGDALARHPDVDMISFTGSKRAGVSISKAAADTIKRVTLELGGKSPSIVFDDADIDAAVKWTVEKCFENTGQSCNAPTRMLVQRSVYNHAVKTAHKIGMRFQNADSEEGSSHLGPASTKMQFEKIQSLIDKGIQGGAKLVIGGPGRPDGITRGFYVKPTIFSDVDNAMTIAQEEIFGPVLAIIPFETEEDAIRIANDTPYGLAAYVASENSDRAIRVARQLRVGMVQINGASPATDSPFGGYKQSGNGREGGEFGIEDYLEIKSISGYSP